jgi:hypothetical protein
MGELSGRFPGMELNGHFSWSPDGRQAVLLYEDCSNGDGCQQTVMLATNDFQEIQELAGLPPGFQLNQIIWSPDGAAVALFQDIHQGAVSPPQIFTINLPDHSANSYVFPTQSILRNVQWVR